MSQPVVVTLFSGGLDSAVLTHERIVQYGADRVVGVFFDYGQRGRAAETLAVTTLASLWKMSVRVLAIRDAFAEFRSGLLPGLGQPEIFRDRPLTEIKKDLQGYGERTYVPFRNAIFLSLAVGLAESLGVERIEIGVKGDVGFDVSARFVAAFEAMARVGSRTQDRLQIAAPLIGRTKADIIRYALAHGFFGLTYSCYSGEVPPCGWCDACRERKVAADGV